MSLSSLLDFPMEDLLRIARLAGDAVMAVYGSGPAPVQRKSDLSPVTEADLAAHRVLHEQLGKLLPGCPVVSEEDDGSQAYRHGQGRFWLIDPLDGTEEFIARNGEFTVNIALIAEGLSILGVVYAPVVDTLYWGGPGLGAYRRAAGATSRLHLDPRQGDGVRRVVASKRHLNAATRSFIDSLGQVTLVQAGSSLKFCRLAEGEADIYPRLAPTCEWDTAAAQAVLEGAGGVVLDRQGHPLRYGKPDILNPPFVAARDRAMIPA